MTPDSAFWHYMASHPNMRRLSRAEAEIQFGQIPVATDPRLPRDVIQLRDADGRVCGEMRLKAEP